MRRSGTIILLITIILFLTASLPKLTNILFLDDFLVIEKPMKPEEKVKEQKKLFLSIFKDTYQTNFYQENMIAFVDLIGIDEQPLDSEEVNQLQKAMIVPTLKGIFQETIQYFTGIPSGESFYYEVGDPFDGIKETRNFIEEITPLFMFSTVTASVAGVVALLFGVMMGMWLAISNGWVKDLFGLISVVPDFAAALLLQLAVVFLFQTTGVLVAEVATTNMDTAILLPLITLIYMPFMYVVRMVSHHTFQILTENYILTAKAKGLNKWYVYTQHVLRNVIPFIKADLHKICSLMIGNLLILEYVFNQPGLATFVFMYGFGQISLTFNSFLCLVLVYFITYGSMQLVIAGLKRGFAHE